MEQIIGELVQQMQALPPETDHLYESRMTKLAMSHASGSHIRALLQMLEQEHPHAYEAFFVLCTIYRRNKDFQKLNVLLRSHYQFSIHPSYNHLLIMYHTHSESFYDYDDLLRLACADAESYPTNPGYLHTFANAFTTICENCNEEDRSTLVKSWYHRAVKAIDTAMALKPKYAKYFCTKGRMLALNREYVKSLDMIQRAISLEDSSRPDYALTISNYQYARLTIATQQQTGALLERLQYLEGQLSRLMAASVEPQEELAPLAYQGTGRYAFVSYAHLDSADVYSVIRTMNSLSMNVWYDSGIAPGEEWPETLGERIEHCSVLFLMISNNSIISRNVRREVNLAISMEKTIIGIFLEDVALSPGMRLQLELTQMIRKYMLSPNEFKQKLLQIPLRTRS